MNMLTVLPPPPDLRPWVQGAVVVRSPAGLAGSRFPALTGSMLVVRLAGSVLVDGPSPAHGQVPLPPKALIAPSTRFTGYAHAGEVHAVGLVLQPAALPCLLQGSAAGWADRHLPLADLPGLHLPSLWDALHAAPDDPARLRLLCQRLRQLVTTHPQHDLRRQRLHRLGQAICTDLAHAPEALGMGTRQLQRLCLAGFGLTPKQYQSITRLQATLRSAWQPPASGGHTNGADLAAEHGFFDQSHLARDMRRLVGTTLTELRQHAGQPETAHWPLHAGRHFTG